MLLAVLHGLIIDMRVNYEAWHGRTRTTAALLEVGLRRADVAHPGLAAQIRADAAGMRTLLEVAADAIVGESSYADAWNRLTPSLVLKPAWMDFFEATLTEALPT